MLKIVSNYLTRNDCYKSGRTIKPIGMQLHTIGTAQNTASQLASYWNQGGIEACVHYCVDAEQEGLVYQFLPDNRRSWADGGFGNNNLITVELMESDFMRYTGGANYVITNDAKFRSNITTAYNTAVQFFAQKCKQYGWNPLEKMSNGLYRVSSHDEGRRLGLSTSHVDPTHVWGKLGFTMDQFRKDVAKAMGGEIVEVNSDMYRVRKSWADESSQIGAFTVLDNAKKACVYGYKVFDNNGNVVFENNTKPSGTQWTEFVGLSEKDAAEKILELARQDYEKSGILASVTAAQMILESGYVTTELSKANNCFGMKTVLSGNSWPNSTWDGVSKVNIATKEEYTPGVITTIHADFRKYPRIEDSVADHSAYLLGAKNGSRLRYEGLTRCPDYRAAITLIKNGGYATDSKYIDKICNIIERYNLARYDKKNAATALPLPKPETGANTQNNAVPAAQPVDKYVVRRTFDETVFQLGAFSVLDNAKALADKNLGYQVFDTTTKAVVYSPSLTAIQKFIAKLMQYDQYMQYDNKNKKQWVYYNGKKSAKTFWNARKNNKRWTNCVSGVQWAAVDSGLCGSDGICWYGQKGGNIRWTTKNAEANAKKYFNIYHINGKKTVKECVSDGTIKPGDIITYVSMNHTNVYLGNNRSFDSGHAYCAKSGEGAPFKKWCGGLSHGSQKVGCILRAKNSTTQPSSKPTVPDTPKPAPSTPSVKPNVKYRVQCGSYKDVKNAKAMVKKMTAKGISASVTNHGLWIAQAGIFSDKSNADRLAKTISAKGLPVAVIKM